MRNQERGKCWSVQRRKLYCADCSSKLNNRFGRILGTAALAVIVLLQAAAAPNDPDPIRFMRDPHYSHGMIAFSYQGDIWLTDANGGDTRRLTSHVARDVSPRFSPDGTMIAFTSNRMGNNDVFVVPVAGGVPRQLTYYTGDDDVQYWTPDGQGLLITTSRSPHPFGAPLHILPLDGGIPVPMEVDFGRAGMIRQDGTMVAFNRNSFLPWPSGTRKGYRGNNSTDVWVQDLQTKQITQLTDLDVHEFREHTHDALPMWGADGFIYFVSERDGIFNIWRISPAGGEPQQVTFHRHGSVRYPAISPDGRTVVYTQEHEIHLLDVPGGQPRKVPIRLAFDPKDNLIDYVSVTNRSDGFAPAPTGDFVAVDFRGEIFIVPVDSSTAEKTQVTASPWRARYQEYSPDGMLLAYISDQSGDEEIWIYDVATGTHRQLTGHEPDRADRLGARLRSVKSRYTWAPDASRIAFVAANRLFEVDVATGRTTELGFNRAGGFSLAESPGAQLIGQSAYSADGKWLVYGRSDDDMNADVYLFDIENRTEYNVSNTPFRDSGGRLTPDGRTVVFTSNRDGGANHLFAVPLTRLTADPRDPLVRAPDRPDADPPADRAPSAAGPSRIDLDGIERRAIQLTSGSNGVGSYFLSRDGRTVYFTSSDGDGAGLFSIGIDGSDRRRIADGSFAGLTPTPDRRYVFFRQDASWLTDSEVYRIQLASPQRREQVRFSFTVEVCHRGDWEQIFEESWRVMKYSFYDENMHGVDWDSVKAEYRPLLPHVGTYEDLYLLVNMMMGELDASHSGIRPSQSRSMPRGYNSRYLGIELEPVGERYRISHVYRDGPADHEWLDLAVGDYVLAIDGEELRAGDNYWRILNHTLNEYVTVQIASSANGRNARDVRIRTVGSLADIRYNEWVERNREFVDRESNGQIAYVHLRTMDQASLRQFEIDIDRYWNAKGVVIDIRYNPGGFIDQELLGILKREPYLFFNGRWSAPTWGRRWRRAIAGPKVMLINQHSTSNSEMTAKGFRQLGLGSIVGNPTAGWVIGTGSYLLIDGQRIFTPGSLVVTYDPTQPNNFGINLENFGVAPDVWVVNSPEDELRGFDRELKAAVDEALRVLRSNTYQYMGYPTGGYR